MTSDHGRSLRLAGNLCAGESAGLHRAARLRDTDTGPGGTGIAHGRPEFILAESQRVFGTVADADYLRGRDRDSFSRSLAWTWVSSLSVEVQNYWSGSGRVGS